MLTNPNFYPTPDRLIRKMMKKVEDHWDAKNVLEPSAGSGNIVKYLNENYPHCKISGIEKDPELCSTLRGRMRSKNREQHLSMDLIDNDFLKFSGSQHFDLIIANFPFSEGDKHLLKAIEIMFSGQIVCLINAETLRNPYTNSRKLLAQKLEKLGANVEFLKEAFGTADRKTDVEVAMVYINVKRDIETELYSGMKKESVKAFKDEIEKSKDIATMDNVANIVLRYNKEKDGVVKCIVDFYKNYDVIGEYLDLTLEGVNDHNLVNLTDIVKSRVNAFVVNIKKKYWQQITELPEVRRRLSSQKKKEFIVDLEQYSKMEFTESNIRQFIINLVCKFPRMIGEAVEYLFKELTKYSLMPDGYVDGVSGNIHYFNGWKTNSGYKVNKKVILPFYGVDWDYTIDKIDYRQEEFLSDMSLIAGYFSHAKEDEAEMVRTLCNNALKAGQNRKIDTRHYVISIFKKGTIHLEFKDDDLLRRFNIEGCRRKGFLPMDYSTKKYDNMSTKEKIQVEHFEGEKNYQIIKGATAPLLNNFKSVLAIPYMQ